MQRDFFIQAETKFQSERETDTHIEQLWPCGSELVDGEGGIDVIHTTHKERHALGRRIRVDTRRDDHFAILNKRGRRVREVCLEYKCLVFVRRQRTQ